MVRFGELDPTDRAIVQLVAAARTNAEIAQEVGLSLGGVKHRLEGILLSTNTADRRELTRWYQDKREGPRSRARAFAFFRNRGQRGPSGRVLRAYGTTSRMLEDLA